MRQFLRGFHHNAGGIHGIKNENEFSVAVKIGIQHRMFQGLFLQDNALTAIENTDPLTIPSDSSSNFLATFIP